MSSAVDTQIIQPRRHTPTRGSVHDEVTPGEIVDQAADPTYWEDTSRLSHLYSQCRDACGDPAGLRIFAASALVVGLMLSAAPVALAQVGRIFVTTPAAFASDEPTRDKATRDESTRDESTRNDGAMGTGYSQGAGNAQRRLTVRSVTGLIKWNGTSQALKCAYGLLFQGSMHACTRDPIVAAMSYRRQLA
jgi:hypothetical protein